MCLTAGVVLQGTIHAAQRGDRDTPPVTSYVDPDSLEITGRPDRVALWLIDSNITAPDSLSSEEECAAFLENLASQLRDHHEESDI